MKKSNLISLCHDLIRENIKDNIKQKELDATRSAFYSEVLELLHPKGILTDPDTSSKGIKELANVLCQVIGPHREGEIENEKERIEFDLYDVDMNETFRDVHKLLYRRDKTKQLQLQAISFVDNLSPINDQNRPAHKLKSIIGIYLEFDKVLTHLDYLSLGLNFQRKTYHLIYMAFYKHIETVITKVIVSQNEYEILSNISNPSFDCTRPKEIRFSLWQRFLQIAHLNIPFSSVRRKTEVKKIY